MILSIYKMPSGNSDYSRNGHYFCAFLYSLHILVLILFKQTAFYWMLTLFTYYL